MAHFSQTFKEMTTKEDNGEINQRRLVINFKISSAERIVGGAFINLNDRKMLITEFLDNEHLSSLESFILQMNNSSADSKVKVIINMPQDLMKEKVQDLLQMCEVNHIIGNKKDFDIKNIHNRIYRFFFCPKSLCIGPYKAQRAQAWRGPRLWAGVFSLTSLISLIYSMYFIDFIDL